MALMLPLQPTLLGLLLLASAIDTTDASPLTRIHIKFVQPEHVQEHGITTDGSRIIEQRSYLSIGRRNNLPENLGYGAASTSHYAAQRSHASVEQLNHLNEPDREYVHQTPDFSNGLDYPDPFLLTGEVAAMAVRYLYGRGEFFFGDIPHERALLFNQELRRRNNLHDHLLRSLRPNSPWYH